MLEIALSRRRMLQAFAVLLCAPTSLKLAATDAIAYRKLLATQILNGVTPMTLSMIDHVFTALEQELGQETVNRLISAVLERDAANISQPFDDKLIEQAAQRALDMFYSGEIKDADGHVDALYYHQAFTWQVLDFAKPPSICGPGFGWWTAKPDGVA